MISDTALDMATDRALVRGLDNDFCNVCVAIKWQRNALEGHCYTMCTTYSPSRVI